MKILTVLLITLLSSNALAYKFASPKDPSAKIVMNHSNAAKQLFPVRLLMVNGENVNVRSDAVWLAPGEYELRFASSVNGDYTQKILGLKERRGLKDWNNTMQITVDADKSYYIAYDASSNQTEDWQPVVYKVK
ncbi:MAG: hypothetical protein ACSHWU_07985 [Marinicella sp.]